VAAHPVSVTALEVVEQAVVAMVPEYPLAHEIPLKVGEAQLAEVHALIEGVLE